MLAESDLVIAFFIRTVTQSAAMLVAELLMQGSLPEAKLDPA